MNTTKLKIFTAILFGCTSLFFACTKNKYSNVVLGYVPVYKSFSIANKIISSDAKPYDNPGKVYQNNSITYQIDQGLGIHVIDCSTVTNAKKIAFINIPGISEMAIKDNVLYADNYSDLVAIDISDIKNVSVITRIENAYELNQLQAPPFTNTYFECVDASKGVVIEWAAKEIINPKCKTF